MNRKFIFVVVLSATTNPLLAQTRNTATNLGRPSSIAAGNDKTGSIAMIGDTQIESEIGMSLEDHLISGVHWKVTDDEIDLSGTVHNKLDKRTAHDIAEAYADGRKVRDHLKEIATTTK